MKTLLTIGYEGAEIHDFIATLIEADVRIVIDVRDLPLSRKHGFSKRALTDYLDESGIQYIHLRDLGDPKPGREAARRGDFKEFKSIFNTHMKGGKAQSAIAEALEISTSQSACLLCYERNPAECHRTIVAEEIASRQNIRVRHIGVREGIARTEGRSRKDGKKLFAVG
ncbi:MAG: DUF488 domain-containing protein [Parvibaculum sp.]